MLISTIYDTYLIPPNVRTHMIDVAAIGLYISNHWTGNPLDITSLTEALLLHDMANIIKFKRPFTLLQGQETYWEGIQDTYIKKYGTNVFDATMFIVKEIGVPQSVITILEEMYVIGMGSLERYQDESHIAEYADTCVTPKGIEGFTLRVQDLIKRYNIPQGDPKIIAWTQNQEVVQKNTNVPLSSIEHYDFSTLTQQIKKTVLRTK